MGAAIRREAEALVNPKQPHSKTFLVSYLSSRTERYQGVFGNLGMYASGIPLGLMVDSKGPRPGVLIGALALGSGYYLIHKGL